MDFTVACIKPTSVIANTVLMHNFESGVDLACARLSLSSDDEWKMQAIKEKVSERKTVGRESHLASHVDVLRGLSRIRNAWRTPENVSVGG